MRIGLYKKSASTACYDSGPELTDSSMFGMASISGMSRSSVKPISRSISISISVILKGRTAEVAGTLQVALKAEIEEGRMRG
jgi:hypothetical protein